MSRSAFIDLKTWTTNNEFTEENFEKVFFSLSASEGDHYFKA